MAEGQKVAARQKENRLSSKISVSVTERHARCPPRERPLPRYDVCFQAESGGLVMSLVRLLGFSTLACGCVIGRYRELATSRDLTYVEEKGGHCELHAHRRNHTLASRAIPPMTNVFTKAS